MRLRLPILVASLLNLLAASPLAAIEPTAVARLVEPSMVRIFVEGPGGAASASGFVVSAQGHVATAYHVVRPHIEMGWDLFVAESGGATGARRVAAVVQAFPDEDLAVLKVEGLDRAPVALSESHADTLTKGMTVFAIGYPGAGERLGADSGTSFTAGIANRIFEGAWTRNGPRIQIVQHSAATNPGNSGGPIVNPCGQVVGMNTEREIALFITPSGMPIVYDVIQGVFFASHVSVLVEKLKALGIPYKGAGKVCRVFLGVASTNFYWIAGGVFVVGLALILLLIKHRPRRVVHIVVYGGAVTRNGARALGHLFRQPPWRRSKLPLWRSAKRGATWRLRCEDVEGGPLDITITEEDMRRVSKGLVIGSDPACDRCLAASGIAKRHAQIVPLGDGLGIVDLHSGTGTTVDDSLVDPGEGPVPLAPGAQVRLGKMKFRVERR